MADARALLRAKRQEARISHPFATYNASGQLKCSVCQSIVKHATAWEGHLGSKAHRTNVAQQREQRQREEAEEAERQSQAASNGKRKADDNDDGDDDSPSPPSDKKRRVEVEPSIFPADFFSDPKRQLPISTEDSDDGDNAMDVSEHPKTAAQSTSAVDVEYQRFQEMLKVDDVDSRPDVYESATIAAEPVMMTMGMDGIPVAEETILEAPELTEEELRAKRAQEERELIMDRILDEERAQEDADNRVSHLKTRLEVLKKRREERAAKKTTKG